MGAMRRRDALGDVRRQQPALLSRSVDVCAQGQVSVTNNGTPVDQLNELECVDGQVYANVWQTDTIVRIDPSNGNVTALIDAAGLLGADAGAVDVLNGIAYDAETKTFLLTGKLWPTMFEVRFVPR